METRKRNISNKTVAYNCAVIAVAAVFAYSILVMAYAIIRSSVTVYGIMQDSERNTNLLASGFSVAYSVVVFSNLMAAFSSIAGSVAAVILKKSLQYFNPGFGFQKAIFISGITGLAILTLMYISFYALLTDWMTFDYAETFIFWFLAPAVILMEVCIKGGSKLNQVLNNGFSG